MNRKTNLKFATDTLLLPTPDAMTDTSPYFSIAIANYNHKNLLPLAIQSVVDQDYKDWEIVIYDDGSTDESPILIETISKTDSRINGVIGARNQGAGFAKNAVLEKCRGKYVGFLDPDDTLSPNALSTMYAATLEHPDAVLLSSKSWHYKESIEDGGPFPLSKPKNGLDWFTSKGGQPTHFAIAHLGAYRRTAGISKHLRKAVDRDFYYKMDEMGESVFIDEFLYYYRRHDLGISTGDSEGAKIYNAEVVKDTYLRRKKNGHPVNMAKTEVRKHLRDAHYFAALQTSTGGEVIKTVKHLYTVLINGSISDLAVVAKLLLISLKNATLKTQ